MCDHKWDSENKYELSKCELCGKYAEECFTPKSNVLKIIFDNVEDADEFKSWMCDGGGEDEFNIDLKFDFDYHKDEDSIIIKREI